MLCGYDEDVFVMEKNAEGSNSSIILVANKTDDKREICMAGYGRKISVFIRMCCDNVLNQKDISEPLVLGPREIVLLVC